MGKLKYFNQDFKNGSVDVEIDGEVITCNMFQDEDGDFYLVYLGKIYFLKDCERK